MRSGWSRKAPGPWCCFAEREAGSGPAAEALGRLRASKARVEVVKCDVSQASSVQEMFRAVGVSLPPVRGVLHSAGVLDDATIENQTVEKFERVFASKVDGAWHLHDASAELGLELDFFVLFSSISSLLGSPGQSNYAAANAALDGLAHFRRSQGLPALSVQWGPWASAGMATEKDTVKRLEAQGISGITNDMGVSALGSLMAQEGVSAQAAVLPVTWSKFAQRSGGRLPPFFSRVARVEAQAAGGPGSGLGGAAELLRSIPAEGRLEYLRNLVLETAKEVSGNTELDADAPLMESGLDSLAQVELRNTLSSRLGGMQLSATLFLDYPTVNAVASYLLEEIMPSGRRGGLQRVVLSAGAASEGLAVVGMACRLPGGSDSPAAFWEMLVEGRDGIVEVPASRWDMNKVFDPNPDAENKCYVRHGGFIDGVELFDAAFFGISGTEAASMDPQQRLLLEVGFEAFASAGFAKGSMRRDLRASSSASATDDWMKLLGDHVHGLHRHWSRGIDGGQSDLVHCSA